MTAHTCIVTAPAGGIAPSCVACGEQFRARSVAERHVLAVAKRFFHRTPAEERQLVQALDSAVSQLISLGDF